MSHNNQNVYDKIQTQSAYEEIGKNLNWPQKKTADNNSEMIQILELPDKKITEAL